LVKYYQKVNIQTYPLASFLGIITCKNNHLFQKMQQKLNKGIKPVETSCHKRLHSVLNHRLYKVIFRVGPDLLFMPDIRPEYPASVVGYCRITGLFLSGNRKSGRVIQHWRIFGPTLVILYLFITLSFFPFREIIRGGDRCSSSASERTKVLPSFWKGPQKMVWFTELTSLLIPCRFCVHPRLRQRSAGSRSWTSWSWPLRTRPKR